MEINTFDIKAALLRSILSYLCENVLNICMSKINNKAIKLYSLISLSQKIKFRSFPTIHGFGCHFEETLGRSVAPSVTVFTNNTQRTFLPD